MLKTCTKCKLVKELSFFTNDKYKKNGLTSQCTKCRYAKKIENIVAVQESNRRQREKNKELRKSPENRAKQKIYREKSRDKRIKNYDPQKRKQYYEQNKENQLINNRKYEQKRSKEEVNYKLARMLRTRLYRATQGNYKTGSAVRDLGCSIEYLKKYIESLFGPGMNWTNRGSGVGKWNLDHIIPLCSFDLMDIKQFLKACHYTNLQPLWHEEHVLKTTKDIARSITKLAA